MVTDKLPREQEARLLMQSKYGYPFQTGKLVLFSNDELIAWGNSVGTQRLFGTLCVNSWDVSSGFILFNGVNIDEFQVYGPGNVPTVNGNIYQNITISFITSLAGCNVTFWGYEFIPL